MFLDELPQRIHTTSAGMRLCGPIDGKKRKRVFDREIPPSSLYILSSSSSSIIIMTRGVIVHREYGSVGTSSASSFDPLRWPDGQNYLDILEAEGIKIIENNNLHDDGDDDSRRDGADYWQAAARWVLMSKYGVLKTTTLPENEDEDASSGTLLNQISYRNDEDKGESGHRHRRHLVLSSETIDAIARRWTELVVEVTNAPSLSTSTIPKDLVEFLRTGQSNGRVMQWTVLECPRGLQFPVHSHPNFELVYNLRGDLHEVRMEGEPVPVDSSSDKNGDVVVAKGPNLTHLRRAWRFGTVREGEWLVNEVGSVHKTFTSSRQDTGGCLLLVVWGGSNANVDPNEEPETPNVQEAVDRMDARLCSCGGGEAGRWEEIQETFLPESERS
jgi:hypothetical protein